MMKKRFLLKNARKPLLGRGTMVQATPLALIVTDISSLRSDEVNSGQPITKESTTASAQEARSPITKVPGIWTFDCEIPVQRPQAITLTCTDEGMLVMDIKWETWNIRGATGTGISSEILCNPNCADGKRIDMPVFVKLSESFEYEGRNVLRSIVITAGNRETYQMVL